MTEASETTADKTEATPVGIEVGKLAVTEGTTVDDAVHVVEEAIAIPFNAISLKSLFCLPPFSLSFFSLSSNKYDYKSRIHTKHVSLILPQVTSWAKIAKLASNKRIDWDFIFCYLKEEEKRI